MEKQNILTGDRPTGKLHLGHYFGSLKNRVALQEQYNTYIIIADVQALTDNFNDTEKVRKNVKEVLLDYLAVGIDPNKSTIFIQSMIPEIAELTVFYSNLVTVSRLYRNPTVKNEIKQKESLFGNDKEGVTYGFLGYPISQTADITAFDGTVIPVGDDQLPMIEQAREIVRKFNSIYGKTLLEPEALLSKTPRIKGLDGSEKMSKSAGNAIYLSDSEKEINDKIMKAVTDPGRIKKDDPGNPDICMVYYYHDLINPENAKTVKKECKAGTRGCVACKKELVNEMMKFLKPIQERRSYYENNPELADKIIQEGTKKAQAKARETVKRVKKNMGIDYFNVE